MVECIVVGTAAVFAGQGISRFTHISKKSRCAASADCFAGCFAHAGEMTVNSNNKNISIMP